MKIVSFCTMVLSATLLVGARSQAANFNLRDLKGNFSFFLNATGSLAASNTTATAQSINRVGVFESDGKGALTGHTISVVDDGTSIVVVDYKWTATYTMKEDGVGTITMNAPSAGDINSCRDGNGGNVGDCEEAFSDEHYSFVIVKGKQEATLSMIQTDTPQTASRMFLRGVAATQEVKKGGGGGGFPIF